MRDIEKLMRERDELNELYRAPKHKKLKVAMYVAIGVTVVLQLVLLFMTIRMDDLPLRTVLFLRGCTGVSAIVFVILAAILIFRVNSEHIRKRGDTRTNKN